MLKKFLQIPVSEELHKKVRLFCAEAGISIAEFIRGLVEAYFSGKH